MQRNLNVRKMILVKNLNYEEIVGKMKFKITDILQFINMQNILD